MFQLPIKKKAGTPVLVLSYFFYSFCLILFCFINMTHTASTERAILDLNTHYVDNKRLILDLQAKLRLGVKDLAQSQPDLCFAIDFIEDQGEEISV
jgi:hypothetical protein